MSKSYFRKSGHCLLMAVVFFLLGVKSSIKGFYARLTKGAITIIMGVLLFGVVISWVVSYAQMKTRLTTTEWQRDNFKIKLDSIRVLNDKSIGHFKFHK